MNISDMLLRRPKRRLLIERRRWRERQARHRLAREPQVWAWLHEYLAQTESTGCSYGDYWTLYSHVRRHRPIEVLECGTGVSTMILAAAMLENEREGWPAGRITSMEDHEKWLEMSRALLPSELAGVVDFTFSPSVEGRFSLFRGMHYQDVPDRRYDFAFVDGPHYRTPDGTLTCDLDLLLILDKAETPLMAVVDKRVSTCWVLQQVLGVENVRFDPALGLAFVGPVTAADVREVRRDTPSLSFAASYSAIGKTRLGFSRDAARRAWR